MAHQTFKVCILIDDNVENFYIKHYIDQINPVFNRFKNQVFTRNPLVNSPNLKIYWIDAENDQILVACEEDFRLFLEEGKGRKIYFSVNNNQKNEEPEATPMEAEILEPERRSRKSHKEHEKGCKRYEKLTKKLKHYQESCKNEEERSRCRHSEKRNERLEKAKRRVEQIRSIIGSIDPANLGSSGTSEPTPSTSSTTETVPQVHSPISPETIQLLSNAIAGCLQPCNVINKVLNEVFAIIPQVVEQTNVLNAEQQQQTAEIPKQNTATNTSDASTPVTRQASHEIEALFKEAAKELEKMNEIVNNNSKMEGSTSSLTTEGTQGTQVTQIERVFQNINDSAISDITVVETMNESQASVDNLDATFTKLTEEPPKSIRSRESSIEIHDVNSIMSDDSRDWTILSQDDISIEPTTSQRSIDPKTGAVPKGTVQSESSSQCDAEIQTTDSVKSISIETQTPTSLLFNKEELQVSVQKSMDIVQKSIETIQKSMESTSSQKLIEHEKQAEPEQGAPSIDIYPTLPTAPLMPEQSKANVKASGINQSPPKPKPKVLPGLIVYDPNPKINAAVHTMMNMGFSNEDNWLTQLLINVDGDIPKALNFLTPQPKNKKP